MRCKKRLAELEKQILENSITAMAALNRLESLIKETMHRTIIMEDYLETTAALISWLQSRVEKIEKSLNMTGGD